MGLKLKRELLQVVVVPASLTHIHKLFENFADSPWKCILAHTVLRHLCIYALENGLNMREHRTFDKRSQNTSL